MKIVLLFLMCIIGAFCIAQKIENTYLKVWIANGYYDLAAPYFATKNVIDHMFLKKVLKDNIWLTYYPAGHMMYISKPSLMQLK